MEIANIILILSLLGAFVVAYRQGALKEKYKGDAQRYMELSRINQNARNEAERNAKASDERTRRFHRKIIELEPGYDPNELWAEAISDQVISYTDNTPISKPNKD